MEANKKEMKATTVYYASVKFEGKWYNSVPSANIEDALEFIKRARLKTHAHFMPATVVEDISGTRLRSNA